MKTILALALLVALLAACAQEEPTPTIEPQPVATDDPAATDTAMPEPEVS